MLLIGLAYPAASQLVEQGTVTPMSAGTSQDLNQYLNEYYERKEGTATRPFEGQTFLHEDWKEYVLVVTFEKDPISIEKAKYDSFAKEIVFQWEEETKYLSQAYVKGFVIRNTSANQERTFINPRYNNLINSESLSLFEVLADGEISLYKEVQHHVQGATGRYDPTSGGTEQQNRLVTEERYFLAKSSTLFPIQPRSRFARILATLTDDEFDVKGFAKKTGLKVNKVADWPAIINAFNQQN
ncbi:MAG TPA: hypothetical protein DCR93_18025 [Cytophagales bacterium]|nr:hypothetical protein [Cytophagales bacterium]